MLRIEQRRLARAVYRRQQRLVQLGLIGKLRHREEVVLDDRNSGCLAVGAGLLRLREGPRLLEHITLLHSRLHPLLR